MSKISAYIIAYNESQKITDAVNSVLWADEVIVVDSHSTDGTADIASGLGAKIVQVSFDGFGHLRNQAITACQHEWIFSLDSDERCTPEVRDEILEIIHSDTARGAYHVPRKNYFMGRWIKHSGWYPNYRQPQLFRKGGLTYTNEPVHEGFELHSKQPIGYLKNPIWQAPFRNLDEVMAKSNRYSSLGVEKLAARGKKPSMVSALLHSIWAFTKHYFFKRGLLDGWPGFIIAINYSYYTFFRYAKYYEQQQDWQIPESMPIHSRDEV